MARRMIAIPVSGEVVRRALRTSVVVAITVASLAFSHQDLLNMNALAPGAPDFYAIGNIVLFPGPRARAAGISRGDRIDYSLVSANERYGDTLNGLREPPAGKPVSYVVEHNGRRHVVTFSAEPWIWGAWGTTRWMIPETAEVAADIVLILLVSALVLIRPTPFTAAFFLFAVPKPAIPFIYSFLPAWGYAALVVMSDTFSGLIPIGFLGMAFYLDPRRRIRSSLALGIGALLLVLAALPVATSDVSELMRGMRPDWPIIGWVSFFARLFCYVAGLVLFARLGVRASTPRAVRLVAVIISSFVAVVMINWSFNWAASVHNGSAYVTILPFLAMTRAPVSGGDTLVWLRVNTAMIFGLLGQLLVLYLIIRGRIADTGPVLSRLVAYVIIVLLLIAAFVVANVTFAPVFPNSALLVPFEILAAIAIGYWVSGMRDVAGSLSLACVDAWNAWAKGHAREERDFLTQSWGMARRTRRAGIMAEVRAQMTFSAWRDGDEGEFERNAGTLQHLLNGRNLRGIRGFADAATFVDEEPRFEHGDLPEWKARAALVRCARTNDAACAQQLATDALASADSAGLASLQVLASIAVAETQPSRRDLSLERAHAIARDAGWPALSKSILALRANSRDIGILQPFVEVRLRRSRPARPMFEVSFFNAELTRNGARVSLQEKELELLLSVASTKAGVNDNDLLDALWPDADGDAARNAFRVCLHRLRKNVSDARIVTRVGKGYVVHPWADVDLWRLQSLISSYREGRGRDGTQLRELTEALRAGYGRRATLGEWFYRFEQMLNLKLDEAERLLEGEAAGVRRN